MTTAYFNRSDGTADAFFDIKGSFGVAANGATAAVTFPEVDWNGTRPTEIDLSYPVPSAPSYDWSSYPATSLTNSTAVWTEPPTSLDVLRLTATTPSKVVTGVNHAAQQRDSNLTLLAGILFGIGGGALVAAVQEALHD
jgi:hypothetical protein